MGKVTITRGDRRYDVDLAAGHVFKRVTVGGEDIDPNEFELTISAEEWQQIREVALPISPARAGDTQAG